MRTNANHTLRSPGRTPIVRRRQADRSALSDRRLTESAIDLLLEFGIKGTTLQVVGERAGYSRALATHRFGSKSGLFTHVLKVAITEWLERMQKTVGTKVGMEAVHAATDATEKFIRERPKIVRVMYMLWFQSIDPGAAFHPNIAAVHRAQRRDVEKWIRAGQKAGRVNRAVNPVRFAEQYCATMAGIAYQWLANDEMPLAAMYGRLRKDVATQLRVSNAAERW
jgi:AcrR family transcriptional regulator